MLTWYDGMLAYVAEHSWKLPPHKIRVETKTKPTARPRHYQVAAEAAQSVSVV